MARHKHKADQPYSSPTALPEPLTPVGPASTEKPGSLRNRVVERRKILGSDLARNPKNCREHPLQQSQALKTILTEIGMAGELLAWHSQRDGGKLTLINGHLRSGDFPNEMWDVAITDLSDIEADKLLAVFDPVGDAAEIDEEKLRALMLEIDTECDALQAILNDAAGIKLSRPPAKRKNPLVIPPDIQAAIGAYCRRQEVPPGENDMIIAALRKFLVQSGDLKVV